MQQRWRHTANLKRTRGTLACPSYEDLRIQSAVLGFVVGEGHHDLTIFELAHRFSQDEGNAVERAVRDLVGVGVLTIEAGKVVPRLVSLTGQPIE